MNIVIWHFQFYVAIKKQPTNVGLFNDPGTYQMSLGFHKVMETLVWLRDAGQTHLWSSGTLWNRDREKVPIKPSIALHRWLHTSVGFCGTEEAIGIRKK